MLRVSDVCVVAPCFNEADHIFYLTQEVRAQGFSMVVVNDGSTDLTREMAERAGAVVVSHPRSRGKGAAIQTGLAQVTAEGHRFAILMDGDRQHSTRDLTSFLEVPEECKLVIGNRMARAKGMPWLRKAVNRWMSAQLSNLTGFRLPDSQCGFRRIEMETWNRLRLSAEHFEVESEMTCEFVRAACYPAFIPIEVIYKKEKSKIRPLADTRRWFSWYFQYSKNWSRPSVMRMPRAPALPETQG